MSCGLVSFWALVGYFCVVNTTWLGLARILAVFTLGFWHVFSDFVCGN